MILRFLREIRVVAGLLTAGDFLRWFFACVRVLPEILRTRSLGPADRAFGDSFSIRNGVGRLDFTRCDFGVIREIFGHRCYAEPMDLRAARCVVDFGANCGAFTLFALSHAPHAHVMAVEAQPEMVSALEANLERNGMSGRAFVRNALVGGVYNAWSQELLVRHPRVGIWNAQEMLPPDQEVDFLKCDIEGAEFQLLDPVPTWLRRVRRFALEYHGDWTKGAELGERLRAAGFVITQRSHRNLGYLTGTRIDG